MRIRGIATLAASAAALAAMVVSAPANAQGPYHHDFNGGYHRGFNGGYGHGFNGGYDHGFGGGGRHVFVGGYRNGFGPNAYRHGYSARYYNHPYAAGWHPGPGYVHHSWAWYHSRPAYWRASHPYHGSPSLGIWIRL